MDSLIFIKKIYCDGGVIQQNPSPIGGTWAYVFLNEKGDRIDSASGSITPLCIGLPTVSNNVTELWAAIEALEVVPVGWAGSLYTDSQVTLRRLVSKTPKLNGVPPSLVKRLEVVKGRMGCFKAYLLKGHPTKKDLASGNSSYSKWNVECDRLCTMAGKRYLDELESPF